MEGEETKKLSFYLGKTLRTNRGEIKVAELCKQWQKMIKNNDKEPLLLTGIKNRNKWTEFEPKLITDAVHIEDFVENECVPFRDGETTDVQAACNEVVIEFAKEYGDPILCSDDSHMATPDRKMVQDIKLAQMGPWKFANSYHRFTGQEAWEHFKYYGISERDFDEWTENNIAWGSRFKDFKLVEPTQLPVSFFPSNSWQAVYDKIKYHGRMRWDDPIYVERLKTEAKLFRDNGTIDLLPYFLIDEEICRIYSQRGALTGLGRGSAAGSLITYLLGITHVDPIRHGLSLERFLTKDRINSGKLPDIDQDFGNRDYLLESRTVNMATVTLDDGSVIKVPTENFVQTSDGFVASVEEALANELDVVDWGPDVEVVQ
jgi:hypothetical protein